MTGSSKIAAAIVIAAALIAWAVVSRPAPRLNEVGRYSFIMIGDKVQRFDTRTGAVLVCTKDRCVAADSDGIRDAYRNDENAFWSHMIGEDDRPSEPRDDPLQRR